ncbi:MAG: hypothetical protein ACJ8GN_13335 [Longimicrobiaceae bacterium]
MYVNHTVRLHGLRERMPGLPGPLLRDLLDAVDRSARGAVRLRLEGRSGTRGGQIPGWVHAAARFDVAGFTENPAGVVLRAPRLRDAIPDRLAQYHLFEEFDSNASGLGVMEQSLDEALRGNEDSDAFDEGLLCSFEEFRRVFRHGVESVEINNGRPDAQVLTVTAAGIEVVRRLQRETPRPQRIRVSGVVDAIRHSDQAFTLVLESGTAIRGVLAEGGPEALVPFFGRIAVVSGWAQFRPSGSLLRVDAEEVHAGTEADLSLWSALPRPLRTGFAPQELRRPQGPRSGLNAIIGQWPGDESEEELLAALADIS